MDLLNAILEHYDQQLGTPDSKVRVRIQGHPEVQLHLLEYRDVPCQDGIVLATLGLASSQLHDFKEELVFLCYREFLSETLLSLVAAVAEEVAASQHPLYRGEVMQLATPLFEMAGLYVYPPVYLSEDFEPIYVRNVPVHVAWLLPIHQAEIDWIKKFGAGAFASLLQERDPDLMDLTRLSIV